VCLQRSGLHAANSCPDDGLSYKTIHDVDVQTARRRRLVPCGPGGSIHDYVPFYFGPLSPMLLRLKSGRVEGYSEGQEPIIYLVSTVESVIEAGLGFVFSDGHGLATFTSWFSDLNDLSKVDWDVVGKRYWADTIDNPDQQRRKQAEFLIHDFCPWWLINEIGVINRDVKLGVEEILHQYSNVLPVNIRQQWYYY